MSSFSSFAPGSSLSFPSASVNSGGFALPPLPAPAPAAKLIEGDDANGKDVPMLDGSEGPSTSAAGGSAVVGTSSGAIAGGAAQQMIPSHGIVPTVQLVYTSILRTSVVLHDADLRAIPIIHVRSTRHAETSSLQST